MNRKNFFICRDDTIAEIQSSFSRFYPKLTINFFSKMKKIVQMNTCVMFSPEVRIREISPDCLDGCIELNNNMTTDDLEKLIQDHFELHVEISPKTGNQTYIASQKSTWSSKKNNPERLRLPERSYTTYFGDVPFGC